jgi:signal transduction histidine kinase/CheY-like chemotaxis protein
VVSGSASQTDALAAIRCGATEYIPKELLLLVPAAIERASREAKAQIELLRMQRLESIGSLANGITHDINNLLFHVVLAVEIVEQSSSDANRKVLRGASATLNRATTLMKQITTFARGKDAGTKTKLDLLPLVNDAATFAREIISKTIAIKLQAAQPVPLIEGSQTQIHQILLNLVVNARDAVGGSDGCITIALDKIEVTDFAVSTAPERISGKFVRLSVQDTGTGISPEALPHLFESFYTTKENGTGIGLSTVRAIARSHGAFIDVSTQFGAGSTFTLMFPAYVQEQMLEPLPELKQGNGELVLVVDDELAILDVVRQILESCNYKVLIAGSGSEALAFFRDKWRDISVVITDMAMATLDGPALAALLREINPAVKIICATGTDSSPELRNRMKANAFLSKPFTSQVLLEAIAGLCQPQANPST